MKPGWNGGFSASADETVAMGKALAAYLEAGDVISLKGDLGAGKTTFMKGVMQSLNANALVKSPTFTLINEYGGKPKLVHMDCFRESNTSRWLNLGIYEYFSDENIVFIEWAEMIADLLPDEMWEIRFDAQSEMERHITLAKR